MTNKQIIEALLELKNNCDGVVMASKPHTLLRNFSYGVGESLQGIIDLIMDEIYKDD